MGGRDALCGGGASIAVSGLRSSLEPTGAGLAAARARTIIKPTPEYICARPKRVSQLAANPNGPDRVPAVYEYRTATQPPGEFFEQVFRRVGTISQVLINFYSGFWAQGGAEGEKDPLGLIGTSRNKNMGSLGNGFVNPCNDPPTEHGEPNANPLTQTHPLCEGSRALGPFRVVGKS